MLFIKKKIINKKDQLVDRENDYFLIKLKFISLKDMIRKV